MMKGYIFDFGGTLDTNGCHWGRFLWHAFQHRQVPVGWEAFSEAYVYVERLLGKGGQIQPDYTFRRTLEIKIRMQLEFLEMLNDVNLRSLVDDVYAMAAKQTSRSREILLQLKSRSPLVLVSNFYGNLSTVLREFGLDGIFDAVVESAVVGVRKPDPRIFLLGVEALGLKPEEVTAVGDSLEKDVIPARQAGCRTVWLQGEGWVRYDYSALEADRVVFSLEELLEKNE